MRLDLRVIVKNTTFELIVSDIVFSKRSFGQALNSVLIIRIETQKQ